MNRRYFLCLSAAGAASALLSACSPASDPGAKPAGSSAPVSGTAAAEPAPTEFYTGLPDAVWDDAVKAGAAKAAKAAMGAFVDVSGGQDAWWGRYAPLLSGPYADDAFHIDVSRISITGVSEPELVNEAKDPLTVHALFVTSDGRWEMVLHREGAASPWLVFGLGRKEDQ